MKHEYYVTKWYYSLYFIFFLAVYGGWKLGLRVGASSRVSIYSLWNNTGVHCDKGNVLYRHSFIDNLTNVASCIKDVSYA
jgi:hypothetical protein